MYLFSRFLGAGGDERAAGDGLRTVLLDIPLVEAHCTRVPDEEFKNEDAMAQVFEAYSMGWSDSTINTRAKRLYSWLTFT